MESKLLTKGSATFWRMLLLIEPVWNRNVIDLCDRVIGICAFNRTSMESKQVKKLSEYRKRIVLLIEPVWNRN